MRIQVVPIAIVVGLFAILAAAIVCTITGCTTGPEIEAPGKPIDAVETTSGGWKPVSTWTLSEVSPGVWFTLNTALYGDSPSKQQFVNAITAEGKPITFRCDGGAATLKPVLVSTPDGKMAAAILMMYEKSDGDSTYTRYELNYPLGGPR